MGGTLLFLGNWGHIVCAAFFAVLTIWASRWLSDQRTGKLLVPALSLTCVWALSVAFSGVHRLETGIAESLRNCSWLICLFVLPRDLGRDAEYQAQGARPLYAVLVLLLVAQSALDILASLSALKAVERDALVAGAVVLRTLWAIGALILIQRIFASCDAAIRPVIAPVAAALAAMWSYDLLLYGCAFLEADRAAALLFALRGTSMALLAPVIALVALTSSRGSVTPSRQLAWRGIGAAAMILAGLAMFYGLAALDDLAVPGLRAAVAGLVFTLVVVVLLVLPATRFHATLKLLAAKHLFRHRYDYREQWMAFADTIGRAERSDVSIDQRLVKAMADITGSAFAMLFIPDRGDHFLFHCDWNWKGEHPAGLDVMPNMLERMRDRSWVVDIAQERVLDRGAVSSWMTQDERFWALVPLIHFDELIGVVALGRPPIMRALDWEDFDMLRAAGRQVASYIAEARGQKALAEARRFDEFNRRFAFIMHDIKNLVSQIGLVARNAERHADNPAFRADMILTLKDCAERMNTLLARLSQHNGRAEPGMTSFAVGDVVNGVVARRGGAHPVIVEGDLSLDIEGDRGRIEQILNHLIQNAIEASDERSPVVIQVTGNGKEICIDVVDHGCGMTAQFVRNELFRPFSSTKQGGFGVGAYEAKSLAQAMGGNLDVESKPGAGSRFTFTLPRAARRAADDNHERAA